MSGYPIRRRDGTFVHFPVKSARWIRRAFRSRLRFRLESTPRRPHCVGMQEEKVQAQDPQNEPNASGKSLEELLAEAQAKIEQQRDAMMRAVAEADNARKRAQAEAASGQKYAVERF